MSLRIRKIARLRARALGKDATKVDGTGRVEKYCDYPANTYYGGPSTQTRVLPHSECEAMADSVNAIAETLRGIRKSLLRDANEAMLVGDDFEEPVSLLVEVGSIADTLGMTAATLRRVVEQIETARKNGSNAYESDGYWGWPQDVVYPMERVRRVIGALAGEEQFSDVVGGLIEARKAMEALVKGGEVAAEADARGEDSAMTASAKVTTKESKYGTFNVTVEVENDAAFQRVAKIANRTCIGGIGYSFEFESEEDAQAFIDAVIDMKGVTDAYMDDEGKSAGRLTTKDFCVTVHGDAGRDSSDESELVQLAREWDVLDYSSGTFDFKSRRDAKGFAREAEKMEGVDSVEIMDLMDGETVELSVQVTTKTLDEALAMLDECGADAAYDALKNGDTEKALEEIETFLAETPNNSRNKDKRMTAQMARQEIQDSEKSAGRTLITKVAREDFVERLGATMHPIERELGEHGDFANDELMTATNEIGAALSSADEDDWAGVVEHLDAAATALDSDEVTEDGGLSGTITALDAFLDEARGYAGGTGEPKSTGRTPVVKDFADDLKAMIAEYDSVLSDDAAEALYDFKVGDIDGNEVIERLEALRDPNDPELEDAIADFISLIEDATVGRRSAAALRTKKRGGDPYRDFMAAVKEFAKPIRVAVNAAMKELGKMTSGGANDTLGEAYFALEEALTEAYWAMKEVPFEEIEDKSAYHDVYPDLEPYGTINEQMPQTASALSSLADFAEKISDKLENVSSQIDIGGLMEAVDMARTVIDEDENGEGAQAAGEASSLGQEILNELESLIDSTDDVGSSQNWAKKIAEMASEFDGLMATAGVECEAGDAVDMSVIDDAVEAVDEYEDKAAPIVTKTTNAWDKAADYAEDFCTDIADALRERDLEEANDIFAEEWDGLSTADQDDRGVKATYRKFERLRELMDAIDADEEKSAPAHAPSPSGTGARARRIRAARARTKASRPSATDAEAAADKMATACGKAVSTAQGAASSLRQMGHPDAMDLGSRVVDEVVGPLLDAQASADDIAAAAGDVAGEAVTAPAYDDFFDED